MKKTVILLLIVSFLSAEEYNAYIIQKQTQFKEDLAHHRAQYQSHRAESQARKKSGEAQKSAKLFLNKNQFTQNKTLREGDQEDFFKKFGKQQKDKLFKKVLIKSRSKRNPQKYHYTVVKKKSDLKKAGVVIDKKSKIKKVYNYVEVKHTVGEAENLGVKIEKGSKVKEAVNIVEIKHSHIKGENPNTGIIIRDKKTPKKIYNEVEMEDTKTGEW